MSEESNGTVIPITDATPLTALQGDRPIKFTPERMEQIKNLIERGMNREQIAETIGTTTNSLALTCSRYGISLRRPRPDWLMAVPRTTRLPKQTAEENSVSENGGRPNVAIFEITVGQRKITAKSPCMCSSNCVSKPR